LRKLFAVLLIGPLAAAPSQRIPAEQSAQPTPTFKTGTKLVEIVIVARDKRGSATGLTKDDFRLGAVEVAFYIENSRSAEIATRRIEIPEDQLALALERGVGLDHAVESRGNAGQLRIVVVKRQARRDL
jgi:hypothetical protein